MNTFELLDLAEAKDLIKNGHFKEALPKLYSLAGSYPDDQDVQNLIKQCFNVQQQPNPAPPPIYYPPPYPAAATMPAPKMSLIEKLNRRYKGSSITDSLIALAILLVALAYLFLFFIPGHPPTWGPFYKEYSDAMKLYKNAALGDRGRVYINVTNPQPDKDGFIEYTRDIGNRAFFRIPQDKQSTIKLVPGKNIIYVQVTERHVNGIVCDIEEAKM